MENKNSQPGSGLTNNQLLKILVVVAVLFLLLYVAIQINTFKNDKLATQPLPAQVQKTNVDFDKVPEKFPTNIPIESGARLTQNYNAVTPEGAFQATRTFVTEKSLTENIDFYTDFLSKDGWKTNLSADQANFKMISGAKDGKKINISADENKISKIKTVTISYTETGK